MCQLDPLTEKNTEQWHSSILSQLEFQKTNIGVTLWINHRIVLPIDNCKAWQTLDYQNPEKRSKLLRGKGPTLSGIRHSSEAMISGNMQYKGKNSYKQRSSNFFLITKERHWLQGCRWEWMRKRSCTSLEKEKLFESNVFTQKPSILPYECSVSRQSVIISLHKGAHSHKPTD